MKLAEHKLVHWLFRASVYMWVQRLSAD